MSEKSVRLLPNTLAVRLFLLASLAALVGIFIVAFLVSLEYRRNAEARLNDILNANIFNLLGTISIDRDGSLTGRPDLGDSRYQLIDSGWYWSVHKIGDADNRLSSSSLSGGAIEVPAGILFDETFQREFQISDVNEQMLQGIEAQVFLGEGNDLFSFRITANQSVLDQDIRTFTSRIAVVLSVFALSIVLVMYGVTRVGLKPISVATRQLSEIRKGIKKRIEGEYPEEISPLIEETNALIASNEMIVERGKTQVGNLAHSLKTPLAVIQNELAGLPKAKRELLLEQTETMRKQVQFYLDRARISARSSTKVVSTPLVPSLEKLSTVISKLNPNLEIELDLKNVNNAVFLGEEPDLQEIFGNLLENASKHAMKKIRIAGHGTNERIRISVEDDGPGMTKEEIKQASRRGGRLDEGKTGWGLGLSIVRDVVDEYAGELEFSRSDLAGLKATVTLPADIQ